HVSYLLVDSESATGAVIDPCGDVDPYLADAWRHGANIKHVFLTEQYDQFRPCYAELGDRACATVYAGAWVHSEFPFMLLKEGDAFGFGRVGLRILETPGHRLEGLTILLQDPRSKDPHPYAAFSGRTLLRGDIGRPAPRMEDGYGASDLASMLFDSLRQKLFRLPEALRIFPSHSGDVDARGLNPETLRAQKEANPGFQPMSREEFVQRVSEGLREGPEDPEAPHQQLRPAALNELLRAQKSGAQVVDDRDPADFAAAHLRGSLNLPAAAELSSWVEGVLDRTRPILMVTRPGGENVAASRLARAGFPLVAGFLDGGMESLGGRSPCVERRRRMSFPSLVSRLLQGSPAVLLDTRSSISESTGPLVSDYRIRLERLREEWSSIPRGPELIVCDDTPYRSSAAASLLRREGFENVTEVAGGLALWGSPVNSRQ
ncbi:MAG TPA: rhodanese-like domain-containing protein, partial [Planctomycetota bacterium]|nr:rhodanese-like domain-containing protein [Planctomycetota bacterium]